MLTCGPLIGLGEPQLAAGLVDPGPGREVPESALGLREARRESVAVEDCASFDMIEFRSASLERIVVVVEVRVDCLSDAVSLRMLAFDDVLGTIGLSVASRGTGSCSWARSISS